MPPVGLDHRQSAPDSHFVEKISNKVEIIREKSGQIIRELTGTLKTEMLQGGCFIDSRDARTELFACIDSYYNIHRRHSSLGYLSPAECEAQNLSLN